MSNKFSDFTCREMSKLMYGRLIGEGAYRKVYLNRLDPKTVIKVEEGAQSFCNVKEWEIWQQLEEHSSHKFLAACKAISPCGSVMIQERTSPIPMHDLPKQIPSFLKSDLKSENWGWSLKKHPACHDYANARLMDHVRLVNVQWLRG